MLSEKPSRRGRTACGGEGVFMRFCEILSDLMILSTYITSFDFCFGKICSDTEKLKYGDVFVCRRGSHADGHDFIKKAYENGARTFVVDRIVPYLKENPELRYICVSDTSLAEVKMLDAAFGHPSRNMKLIGITGTNGKTSTAYMIKAIFDAAGYTTGLIGTVKTLVGSDDITRASAASKFNSMTTPSPSELYSVLADMSKRGTEVVVMEASSHALAQKRLDGLRFSLGIFTNLTEDHLDYHKTFADYRAAKAHLFELSEKALINSDSPDGKIIESGCPCRAYTYAQFSDADFTASDTSYGEANTRFTMKYGENGENSVQIDCPIPGEFTVYNVLAAASAAKLFGLSDTVIREAFEKLPQIPGRLERVNVPVHINVFIDYAHTPDALEKALNTLKATCRGRLITVFGCGGDREREKRPMMGRIATNISDITVITSDNCRTENPQKIISEIVLGAKRNSNYKVIENRKEAIRYALSVAKESDTVLLAGKGHEDYEIVGKEKRHFSERETIRDFYNKR